MRFARGACTPDATGTVSTIMSGNGAMGAKTADGTVSMATPDIAGAAFTMGTTLMIVPVCINDPGRCFICIGAVSWTASDTIIVSTATGADSGFDATPADSAAVVFMESTVVFDNARVSADDVVV